MPGQLTASDEFAGSPGLRRAPVELLAALAAACALVGIREHAALLVVATDAAAVLGVLGAALGLGLAVVRMLPRTATPTHAIQRTAVGAGLGLGVVGWLALAFGVAGWLNRTVALFIIVVGWVLLHIEIVRAGGRRGVGASPHGVRPNEETRQECASTRWARWAAAAAGAWPLALGLLVVTLPPGVLWLAEGRGYDVLEYHLEGPREWFQAGRIQFLAHNVYTNFPQQMEMHYLLLMHLIGDPYAAAVPAQMLHALFGVLALVAVAAFAPPGPSRILTLASAVFVPWFVYLGALAYVELGMLLFAALAIGLWLEPLRKGTVPDWRQVALSGVFAGLAAGCKYTAIVLVGVAIAVAAAAMLKASLRARARCVAVFTVAATLAFSPWLARNAIQAGNPVYPFAYDIFGGRAWSEEQAHQWGKGHQTRSDQIAIPARLELAARELFGGWRDDTQRFAPSLVGVVLIPVAIIGFLRRRSREAVFLTCTTATVLVAWMALTHMPGRFAVPILIPLAWLAGLAAMPGGADGRRPKRFDALGWCCLGFALLGGLLNMTSIEARLAHNDRVWQRTAGISLYALTGLTHELQAAHPVNQATPADAKVWLIGDAAVFYVDRPMRYTVVFNRDALLDKVASSLPADRLAIIHAAGITHVVINWSEINRLRDTYGFDQRVTRPWAVETFHAAARHPESSYAWEVFDVREASAAASTQP